MCVFVEGGLTGHFNEQISAAIKQKVSCVTVAADKKVESLPSVDRSDTTVLLHNANRR